MDEATDGAVASRGSSPLDSRPAERRPTCLCCTEMTGACSGELHLICVHGCTHRNAPVSTCMLGILHSPDELSGSETRRLPLRKPKALLNADRRFAA